MNLTSISSISGNIPGQAIQRQPEAREIGPDRDGDADDARKAAPAATVNLNGQNVGQQISVTA